MDKLEFMEVFFCEYTKVKKNSKLRSIKHLINIFRSLIAYQNGRRIEKVNPTRLKDSAVLLFRYARLLVSLL